VIVDAGDNEKNIINSLREKYAQSNWRDSQFRQLSKHDFEEFYPERFREQVEEVLGVVDRKERRDKKRKLLLEVIKFCQDDPEVAKDEFNDSASEIVELIREIEGQLDISRDT
ncbi:MAG: hypothetical protein R3270_02505, partial [Gammaproteobacteria bacterium]|nr:hypothetical protein [Gammaproteobacteria bacterium]